MEETRFKAALGVWDATMIVAGSMIGSGIFIVSADILQNVGSAGWLILVWVITGFMTITAAVSYGELSGMFPRAGGQYVYLKECYNPLVAFLYGWSFFAVIQTGTIAAVGVAFAKFTAYFVPALSENIVLVDFGFFHISPAQVFAIVMIFVLTVINSRGIESGRFVQTTFTVTKILSLLGLVVFGFIMMKPDVWSANWHSGAWSIHPLTTDPSAAAPSYTLFAALGAIAAAMVGSIFSSDAWNNVTFIAGEIRNPQRNIGLSLFLGTLIVTVLYVLTNVMYVAVLPLHNLAFSANSVGVETSQAIFGTGGAVIITAMMMVSTFGCNNGLILAGARVYYSMAKDGLFFRKVGELNRFAVPGNGLWFQFVFASALSLSGKYGDLLQMISFVVVAFYILTIAGIFKLRRTRPDAPRPYRAFGYPILPAIYMLMGAVFCVLLIIYEPRYTVPGLIITLLGIPLYRVAVARRKPA